MVKVGSMIGLGLRLGGWVVEEVPAIQLRENGSAPKVIRIFSALRFVLYKKLQCSYL